MPVLLLPLAYKAASAWWLTHVSSGDDAFAVFVMWFSTEITFWMVNLFFYVIEAMDWFTKHKIHKQNTDMDQFLSTLLHKPVTYIADIPIYWASYRLGGFFRGSVISPHDALPGLGEILLHVFLCTVTFDLMFYMWHRFLHTKWMYPYHKKHHEVRVTYACANDHESFLEVTGNIVWKMIPPAVLGSHVYTVCIFRSIVKFFALLHHSGYELPVFAPLQRIPFMSSPSHHDFHHYNGHSNYGGVFMLWDYLFGTFRTWDEKAASKCKRSSVMNLLKTQREVAGMAKMDLDVLPDEALRRLLADSTPACAEKAKTNRRESLLRLLAQGGLD